MEILLPLSYTKAGEVFVLFKEIIEDKKQFADSQIKELSTEELCSCLTIHPLAGEALCDPQPKSNLSEAVKDFVLSCYALAHNRLALQRV